MSYGTQIEEAAKKLGFSDKQWVDNNPKETKKMEALKRAFVEMGVDVSSTSAVFWAYVFRKFWQATVGFVAALIMILGFMFGIDEIFAFFLVPYVMILGFYLLVLFVFSYSFSGWVVEGHTDVYKKMSYKGDLKSLSGYFFDVGSDQKIRYEYVKKIQGFNVRLLHYEYEVKDCDYEYVVSEITFEDALNFPHILLKSKLLHYTASSYINTGDEKVVLDPRYEEEFSLHISRGYHIEVYQIFSKRLLDYLADRSDAVSIEFSNNKVYIFERLWAASAVEDTVNCVVDVTEKFIETSGPLINRLHDDFDALHTVYKK